MYDLHLPDAARVTEITLTHLEGQQLKLSIVFLKAAPRAPRAIISPINGQPMDEPGSLRYTVGFDIVNTKSPGLLLESPSRDTPEWNYTPIQWHSGSPASTSPGVGQYHR
jgi:hypothetical protein